MSDDDDFRKDVIEQKIKKVVEEIGFTKKIVYKVESTDIFHRERHFNTIIVFRTCSGGLTALLTTGSPL